MNPKLSVLVAVYNVQPFIERCVHSLMQQTIQDVEFIFVDDASTDDSVCLLESVIELYPDRKSFVRILRHDYNRGSAAARNTAFDAARGEYVICCDADDWVEPDYCSSLIEKAEETHADIVICDYYLEHKDRTEKYVFEEYSDYQQLIETTETYPWNLWCRLVRRSLLVDNNLRCYDGINMAEDMGLMIRAHYFSKQTVYLHRPLYHYNCTNPNSYLHLDCNPKSDKQYEYVRELLSCLDKLSDFLRQQNISPDRLCLVKRKDIVGTVIRTQHFDLLDSSYKGVIPSLMRWTYLPLSYRLVLSCALLGIPQPLRLYIKLSSLVHSRL